MKTVRKASSMELSIIIVNYNTKSLTQQTIESIIKSTSNLKYEIVVVDNSSDINQKYIAGAENIKVFGIDNKGFGNACNYGAKHALGEFLLFLNSDTIVHENTLEKCKNFISQSINVGALGCKVILENGSLDHGCKRGFPTPMNSIFYFIGFDKLFPKSKILGAYRLNYLDENETHYVDSISGAFLMISKKTFFEVGEFDEKFFMYGEDLDLCFRIHKDGLNVVYFPEAVITHLKGQSGLHTSSRRTIEHFYNAMLIFYRKHYMKRLGIMLYPFVFVAVKLKYIITIMRRTRHG